MVAGTMGIRGLFGLILSLRFCSASFDIMLLVVVSLNVLLLVRVIVCIRCIVLRGLSRLVFWVLGLLFCMSMLVTVFLVLVSTIVVLVS